jgi:UDP-glucose 4-epimerase
MKTLVVTGLFSPLGGAIAQWAVDQGVRVLGVDIKHMTRPFPGVEFIHADIRNPLFPELLKAEKVDAIFHSAFRWRVRRSEDVFESNVMGTMKLMGAAALAGVEKVVFPSSAFVYGAHPSNPYFMTENNEFQGRSHYAYVRELRDVETFLSGFRRQHPEMNITVLRFANILGGGYPSPLARYLSLPAIPTLMGYDPLMQVIHFEDALRASIRALEENHPGVYNIATSPPLPLMKIIRLSGGHSLPVFHPLAYAGQNLTGMVFKKSKELIPIHWDFLRYPWTISTEKVQTEWNFTPEYDAETTIALFTEELHIRGENNPLTKAAHSTANVAASIAAGGAHRAKSLFSHPD